MKRKDAEQWAAAWVRPFWLQNIATIVIDHVIKAEKGRGKYSIGSERKLGGVDVHLGFEPIRELTRGGHGLYKIACHKDRPGYLTVPTPASSSSQATPTRTRSAGRSNPPAKAARTARRVSVPPR